MCSRTSINAWGYSSTIRGWLEANGHRFALAQVGPDFRAVRQSVATLPTDAELIIEIDGTERRKRVFLQAGISETPFRRQILPISNWQTLRRPSWLALAGDDLLINLSTRGVMSLSLGVDNGRFHFLARTIQAMLFFG